MARYYKINSENISYRIINDETVILNLKTGEYYSLNQTGTFIWRLMEDKMSMEELTDKVSEEFKIDKKIAIRDIGLLLKNLISERVVKCGNDFY